MKWFGRKGAPRARPLLFSGWRHLFAAEPWPRSYEAQVREAYLANPVAQRAVRLVAESVAWAPVFASEARAEAAALVPPALLETVATQLLLHGNAFVQLLQDAEGRPAELFALRPERVSVEADAGGWPAAYLYKVGEAKSRIAAKDGLGRPGARPFEGRPPARTTIMGWAASARRRARSRSTMRRRSGTRRCSTMRRGRRALWSTRPGTARRCPTAQFERLRGRDGGALFGRRQCRAAAAARRRPHMAGDEPDPGRDGFRRAEGGGGARDRAGVRGAADAARPAGRFDLRQLQGGEPGAVAADRAADGGADPAPGSRARWRLVAGAQARGRPRPDQRARRGARAALAPGQRRRLPERRGETRDAGIRARGVWRDKTGPAGRTAAWRRAR